MGDFREKKSCRLISRGKKILARKCLAKKNSYTEEKRNLLWRLLEENLTPMYVRKKLSPEVWDKIFPPPPTLLLPKANGRPLV